MAKINISIDDELLSRVDNYSKKMYTSRSGLISISLASFINSQEVIIAVNDMSLAMRKIADKGLVDDETLEKLQDFERVAKLLLQAKVE